MKELENKFILTTKKILEVLGTNFDQNVILDKLNVSVWINFVNTFLKDQSNSNLINDNSSIDNIKSLIYKKSHGSYISEFDCIDALRKSYFTILQEFISNLEDNFSRDKTTKLRKIVSEGI